MPIDEKDIAAIKKTKENEIAKLRAQKEAIVYNFNLFHEATREELAAIDQAIAKAAEGLHHVEGVRTERPAPAPTAVPQPAPATAPPPATTQARGPRVETVERDGKERHVWEEGRHKVYGEDGRLLLDEEDKPDFPVEVPKHAARTKAVTAWEGVGHPEWSPADEIDERGRRHVRKGGRHRVYAQDGQLLEDLADVPVDAIGPNGAS